MDAGRRMTQMPGISLASLVDAQIIIAVQDSSTKKWHEEIVPDLMAATASDLLPEVVRLQHLANFELWHLEDEARSPYAMEREVAMVKKRIDRVNQQRNDLMERCDALLLQALRSHGLPSPVAPLHSESPGLMLDRMSILALKIFHTREEIQRPDASPGHVRRNRERMELLLEQRSDLAECVDRLWEQVIHGQRRFKIYHQLKMYNDPALNPAVYRKPNA
jgi:Protein of unknown function (DUF4254)